MSTVKIYDGNPGPVSGSTPFGFYDNDAQFQLEAPRVARYVATRLGYPLVDVELQSGSIYACFEQAITVYGNEIYQWKIRENFLSLEGTSTGSVLNNHVISPNLGNIIRISQNYGTEAGSGGNTTYYKGAIDMTPGEQNYNLTAWAQASASLQPGDNIEIKRIFYEAPPAIMRFFDPYAGTGTGIQSLMDSFGFGNYSPGINFMLMPIYYDVSKVQAIEFNDQIRKSHYSFEITNNNLKLFPIPTTEGKLFFEYVKLSERNNPINSNLSGSNLISDLSNVPYQNPTYAFINSPGKQWIYEYTLALCKEQLAYIRGKYTVVPVPGSEVTLNQQDLLNDMREEKRALLEQLRGTLDEVSRKKQLQNKNEEADAMRNTLNNVPMLIYIG